ncbi:MAG: GGDEF domain-containing protein, partial [Sphingomonas sp.]
MNGAIFALLVNIGVAVLFAAAFAVVAATYRQQRAALWFCASYMMGMLTPASEVLIHFTGVKTPFMISSYVCFLASQLLMVAGLTVLYGRRPRWGVIATIFAVGMVVRAVIWGGTRSTLPYEMVFQFPWVVISLLMCVTIVQGERLKKLDYALAFTFQLIALHFMLKPFLSVAFGSGAAARDYTGSAY